VTGLIEANASIALTVEHRTCNAGVGGSNPSGGSRNNDYRVPLAEVAQLVERDLAKVEVAGSSPVFRSMAILPELKKTTKPMKRIFATLTIASALAFAACSFEPTETTETTEVETTVDSSAVDSTAELFPADTTASE
jgi:hypothetical protein